ncbi:hypothetical protein Achl_0983 [Pseudarthrobacter chlorophenolicus A6]|uniref:Biotin synthase auxiliary protein n=1 Tax=Pseudarthrobacter chlorophenolicus (strain ATCC 700700 / DSM 12829 / CIP 107037 / JCM 12360 / KCTC 9906 / NCIMB 13794 / A6) TaxID=452863 RepID=B8HDH3_PSECP|nr:hypothetical protein [Pseudarthrobacter chlorophenolicus]ACL38978.1 hypothetical protein Achl_0983 [Pseudarthrobacter chlorophenolicus A6]SDR06123.1 hypothetical protein SAMN04489738_4546 [Pseudarthrobacter chlorophenolicus]
MNTIPPGASPDAAALYCGLCGEPREENAREDSPGERPHRRKDADDGGTRPPSSAHLRCASALHLEPPRFCGHCARRLKVQVTPQGWWASCSRHGVTTYPASEP